MKVCRLCLMLLLLLSANIGMAQKEHEVTIRYNDSKGREITLAGTLSMPEGKAPKGGWPAMLLITGSGSQNRDEELLGHKPFKVIADYMAAHGMATLRCDDRGVGGSNGVYADVTPFDLVSDIQAQWHWLSKTKKINPQKIGLLGHSEGGTLASIAAVENPQVAFVVMMASPALPMTEVLLEQNRHIFSLIGVEDTLVERRLAFMREAFVAADSIARADTMQLGKRLNLHFRLLKERHTQGLTKEQKQSIGLTTAECYGWATTMAQPYIRSMMGIDPRHYLSRLDCPFCALYGELDCQVDAKSNADAVDRTCQGNKAPWEVQVHLGTNHLFQPCRSGAVDEYAALGQSPHEDVLQAIGDWLREAGMVR